MKFSGYFSFIFYTLCIITLTSAELYHHHLIIIPKKKCCSRRGPVYLPKARAPTLKDLMWIADENTQSSLHPEEDPLAAASQKLLQSVPPPFVMKEESLDDMEKHKASICSQVPCPPQLQDGPVCACNFKTGNVVSFKNKCDLKKHNCRFDTVFKVILREICPWEFQTRRSGGGGDKEFNYEDSKYYN